VVAAAEIKIRAERRAGELLAVMDRHKTTDGRPGKGSHDVTLLTDIGVTKMQSSRWQQIAGVAEDAMGLVHHRAPAGRAGRWERKGTPCHQPSRGYISLGLDRERSKEQIFKIFVVGKHHRYGFTTIMVNSAHHLFGGQLVI